MNIKKQSEREMVEDLKDQWKKLWVKKIDDPIRGETIADDNFVKLFIEKGTVIHATRDFKPVSFNEVLRLHKIQSCERYFQINPEIGGWKKFSKDFINKQKEIKRKNPLRISKLSMQEKQLKKSGRGWLNK